MSGPPDLAELLGDGTETVLLTQASTAIEARLIRERIAATGGTDRVVVSLGAGRGSARLPEAVLDGGEDVRLVPVRVAWLPEEHAGRRAARLADILPGRDPYHPTERQQRRIMAREPGRAAVLVGEPATVGALRRAVGRDHGRRGPGRFQRLRDPPGHAGARPGRVPPARAQVPDAEPGKRGDPVLAPVPFRTRAGPPGRRTRHLCRGRKRRRSSTSSSRAGAAGSSTSCRPWDG